MLAYKLAKITKGFIVDSMTFKYRRKITITEQSGNNLSDYQVRIDLDATNFDFSHFLNEGKDLRFTDASKNLLQYWVEKMDIAAEEATIWVKVPSIPANSSVNIYMYYGSSEIDSASDGRVCFDFFDDFGCEICSDYDLKFGVFTDLHWTDRANNDTRMGYRCYSERVDKITEVINAFNNEPDLSFVIELGDFIDNEAEGTLTAEEQLQQAESYYSQVQVPRYYVYGNHDVDPDYGVTKEYFKANTAKNDDYEYYDYGNYRIIILDANYGASYTTGEIPDEELTWLENDALNTSKKCIVFTHQPLSEYKGEWSADVRITNRADVRAVLENAGNVIAVIQGHVHGCFKEVINGIPYFTLEGLVDECGADNRPYGIVFVKGNKVFIRGYNGLAGMREAYHTVAPGRQERAEDKYFDVDVSNTKLIQHANIYTAAGDPFGVAYLVGVNLANFEVRVKTKEVDDDIIGVLFCYQNSSAFYHYSYSNNYTGTTADGDNTYYGPKRWIGKDTTAIGDSNLASDNNAPAETDIVEIIIRRFGSSIKVLQDGEEILTATEATYGSGDIGLMTNGCQAGEFHPPFIVRKYTEPEPSVNLGAEEAA